MAKKKLTVGIFREYLDRLEEVSVSLPEIFEDLSPNRTRGRIISGWTRSAATAVHRAGDPHLSTQGSAADRRPAGRAGAKWSSVRPANLSSILAFCGK